MKEKEKKDDGNCHNNNDGDVVKCHVPHYALERPDPPNLHQRPTRLALL